MLKKTLLKNTREFYEKNLPENLLLLKKTNKKHKKLVILKGKLVANKLLKFRAAKSQLHGSNTKSNFHVSNVSELHSVSSNVPFTQSFQPILFSIHAMKSEFEKKQTRSSDFKNKIKEKKKLSILYGNLSNKEITKNLEKAHTLHGSTKENFLLLLESRLDIILYRALFFPSIKFARHWIKTHKILVNSQCVTIPSYKAKFGDVISITEKKKRFIGNTILKFLNYYNFVTTNYNKVNPEKLMQPWTMYIHEIHALLGKKIQKLMKKVNSQKKNAAIWSIFSHFSFLQKKKDLFSFCVANQGFAPFTFLKSYFHAKNTFFPIHHERKMTNLKPLKAYVGYTYLETTPKMFPNFKDVNFQVLHDSIENLTRKNTVSFLPPNTLTYPLNLAGVALQRKTQGKKAKLSVDLLQYGVSSYFSFLHFFRCFRYLFCSLALVALQRKGQGKKQDKGCGFGCFATQNVTQETHQSVPNLFFNKQRFVGFMSTKFKQKKNVFREKHRYIISNFYLTQLQNQIQPINTFFTEQSVNKLKQTSLLSGEKSVTNPLQPYKKIHISVLQTKQQTHLNNSFTSKKILFLNTFMYKKSIIYLAWVHKNIVNQTQKIGNFIVGNKFIDDKQRKNFMHALKKWTFGNHYDMLTFLKLKAVFFKKKQYGNTSTVKKSFQGDFVETQAQPSLLPFFRKKINYKPLNLEISYKTLTIIYLYPSQKLLFPCTLDIELLVKKKSTI